MVIAIIVIVVIVIIIIASSNSSKTITQPTTTTGNLRSSYSNFVSALTSTYSNRITLICDDNNKIVYRLFQTDAQDNITGEFLFTLQQTSQGHYIMVTLKGGNGKLYTSDKKYFELEQSEQAYKETIGPLGFRIAAQAAGHLLSKAFR